MNIGQHSSKILQFSNHCIKLSSFFFLEFINFGLIIYSWYIFIGLMPRAKILKTKISSHSDAQHGKYVHCGNLFPIL